MKIIGINGSPGPRGNTCLKHWTPWERSLPRKGWNLTSSTLATSSPPCSGCFRCAKTHTCTLPDDGLNAMYEQLIQADGIVLASPVYFASVTSGMRCFLDRIGCIDMNNGRKLRMKVGVPVAVAHAGRGRKRRGRAFPLPQLRPDTHPRFPTGPWPFGQAPGEVAQDAEGIQTLQVLAQEMVYVMKVLDAGKAQVPLPPLPRKSLHQLCAIREGATMRKKYLFAAIILVALCVVLILLGLRQSGALTTGSTTEGGSVSTQTEVQAPITATLSVCGDIMSHSPRPTTPMTPPQTPTTTAPASNM